MTRPLLRKIDTQGRINIPAAYRKMMGVNIGDKVELIMQDEYFLIKKSEKKIRCDVTGRYSSDIKKVGKLNVSGEGVKFLKKLIDEGHL